MTSSTESRHVETRVAVPSTQDGDDNWQVARRCCSPRLTRFPNVPRFSWQCRAPVTPPLFRSPGRGYSEARTTTGAAPSWSHWITSGSASSAPPFEVTTMDVVAAANNAAVNSILDSLRNGALAPGVRPSTLRASSAPASRWVGTSSPGCRPITEPSMELRCWVEHGVHRHAEQAGGFTSRRSRGNAARRSSRPSHPGNGLALRLLLGRRSRGVRRG